MVMETIAGMLNLQALVHVLEKQVKTAVYGIIFPSPRSWASPVRSRFSEENCMLAKVVIVLGVLGVLLVRRCRGLGSSAGAYERASELGRGSTRDNPRRAGAYSLLLYLGDRCRTAGRREKEETTVEKQGGKSEICKTCN